MIWKISQYIRYSNIQNNNLYPLIDKPLFRNISNDREYNSGKDFRPNITEPDFDFTIYKKYELLKGLESSDSNMKKMDIIDINSYLFHITTIYNITAGGLLDDYNFDFF
tara:strand:- start:2039 stop:2365 length:327 start_codon:yes stop_codon:yes gene_type:complete